jgi:hypothetical protein
MRNQETTLAHPMLDAISQMGKLPYGSEGCGGLKELSYRGKVLLPKGEKSICVSAVYEVLWRAFEATGKLTELGVDILGVLKNWVWVMGDEVPENPYYTGVAGGIVELGLGQWVCRGEYLVRHYAAPEFLHIELGDPALLLPGDVAQFYDYDGEEKTFGHSVIVVGQTVNKEGKPAIMTYSSDREVNNGHGYDYWSIQHPDITKDRIWFGARFNLDF